MVDYPVHGDDEVKILAVLSCLLDHHFCYEELSIRSCEDQDGESEGCLLSYLFYPHYSSCKEVVGAHHLVPVSIFFKPIMSQFHT